MLPYMQDFVNKKYFKCTCKIDYRIGARANTSTRYSSPSETLWHVGDRKPLRGNNNNASHKFHHIFGLRNLNTTALVEFIALFVAAPNNAVDLDA